MGEKAKQETHDPPRLVPWLQALAIVSVVGLAAFNITRPDAEVPVVVYAIIAAIAVGLDPGSIWNLFKGGK